ncbi:Phytocyanin domain-containing protein [Citrus sinensis]|nr:Phytocyanin domain-containing protein [Citrus sinensis]
MAMAKSAVISLTIMALLGASVAATTYTVGDNAGWTTQGKVDYYSWVDGKEFKVGDTLVFKYNNAMHDVHEVTEADYVACNAKASIKHHISGSDAITLNAPGIYYFICGIPGHCQAGQRLRIEVESDGSPGASPSAAPGQSPTTSSTSTGGSASTVPPGGGSGSTPPSSSSALLPYSLHTFEVMLSNYWNPNTLCPMFQVLLFHRGWGSRVRI